MKKEFVLEWQYQEYLKRAGASEEKMHPVQRIETRRAFMGACGQMLIMLKEDMPENEEEAIQVLDNMMEQVTMFWMAEAELEKRMKGIKPD